MPASTSTGGSGFGGFAFCEHLCMIQQSIPMKITIFNHIWMRCRAGHLDLSIYCKIANIYASWPPVEYTAYYEQDQMTYSDVLPMASTPSTPSPPTTVYTGTLVVFACRREIEQVVYLDSDHTARSCLFSSTRAPTKNALNTVIRGRQS